MDGLDEFEKTLAAEKAARESAERERRHGKHGHGHRHHHRRHRHDAAERAQDGDEDGSGDRSHRHDGSERARDRDEDLSRNRRHRHDGSERAQDRDEDVSRDRRHRRRDTEADGDGGDDSHKHRHKRSRHSRNDGGDDRDSHRRHDQPRHAHRDESPGKGPDAEAVGASKPLVRDAWMSAPSALDVERIHRPDRAQPKPPSEEPKRVIHSRELNTSLLAPEDDGPPGGARQTVDYAFGDDGSSWRMTKLKAVYRTADESGRPVEEVALDKYGTLEEFDEAREEELELERRHRYGRGYKAQEKPTGQLYQERQQRRAVEQPEPESEVETEPNLKPKPESQPEQGRVVPEAPASNKTELNRLRAQMMKAKLRRAPEAARLEEEYNRAAAAQASLPSAPEAVVLSAMDNRLLAGRRAEAKAAHTRRGRERGALEDNDDMTVDDMVREERRTRGQAGGEGLRLAERIARDARFETDHDYLDANAARLARRVHKSDAALKAAAVGELQRASRALERCPLCHDEAAGRPPLAPVVSLATRVFLTLAPRPEVAEGGAVIAPLAHRANLLECDDDEWEEVRNFMKALTRLYHAQGRDVVFYENAAAQGPDARLRRHASMAAAPIPYARGATAPAFFREAMLAADAEWSQHPKVVDTAARARDGGLGRAAFRRSLAPEAPYFHAWFGLDGGLGHVVEDPRRWPPADRFAREVLAAVVDAEPGLARRRARWEGADADRVPAFRAAWHRFDWTRVLVADDG